MNPANKLTKEIYLSRAYNKHGNQYDYSKVDYQGMAKPITIGCPYHGFFEQIAESHLKYGCKTCGNVKKGKSRSATLVSKLDDRSEKFFKKVKDKHGETYDYSNTKFIDVRLPIDIFCRKHGNFTQIARVHASGSGCQKCAKESSTSKPEQEWLDSLNIDMQYRNQFIKAGSKRLSVDAYDPTTKTVYEFWGDYWHGNPNCSKSSKSLYRLRRFT